MKKLLSYLMLFSIVIGSLFALSGCGKDSYIEVSSVDELYAMKSNECYQLTCDIDLQEREWYPLEVKGFNGNGHTIKNCYINETVGGYDIGFFTEIKWLEHVIFDNIQLNISFTDSDHTKSNGLFSETYSHDNIAGIVVGSAEKPIENITVLNSQAIYNIGTNCNMGVRLGGIVGYGGILNSKIENSSIICNVFSDSCYRICIGGLTGYTYHNICNSKVLNNKINCISKSSISCGGVTGWLDSGNNNISDCIVKENTIEMQSSSSTSLVGGVVGYCGENVEINNCASIVNNIKANSSYGYNIGGIIGSANGKISNCLSDSNILEGITSSTESKQYAGIGGLCGSTSATISKSVAQNNKIIGTSSTKSDSMFAAGFITSTTASIVNCAVYNNTVNGGNKDIFTSKNEDMLFNCYIADNGQTSPNVNNLPTISDKNWKDIINILSLDEELWTFESGYLNLKIAE